MRVFDDVISSEPVETRRAFLQVLWWIIDADGVLDQRELAFVDAVRQRLDLDEVGSPADAPEESWADLLGPVAHYVLMQCALLATADGECHLRERERMEDLARLLDAEPGSVDEMVAWAWEGHRWMGCGMAFLSLDERTAAARA